MTPVDAAVSNGAQKSARLTVECIAKFIQFPEAEVGGWEGFWTQVGTKDGWVTLMCDGYHEPQFLGDRCVAEIDNILATFNLSVETTTTFGAVRHFIALAWGARRSLGSKEPIMASSYGCKKVMLADGVFD